jgi:hypothetical protein
MMLPRGRESQSAEPLLQAADFTPYPDFVSLFEQQAAGENGHGGDSHRVTEAGKNVVLRKQMARSLEDEPHS